MIQDGWPDASEFPYIALIRIRYAHELDLEVLHIVQRAVARTLAPDVATPVAKTITAAAARVAKAGMERPVPIEEAASAATFATFRSVLDDEDLCPKPFPWPWPGPHHRFDPSPQPWRFVLGPQPDPWQEISMVDAVRVLISAHAALGAIVDRETAENVGATLNATLDQLAG
jgi:hypothetical protein